MLRNPCFHISCTLAIKSNLFKHCCFPVVTCVKYEKKTKLSAPLSSLILRQRSLFGCAEIISFKSSHHAITRTILKGTHYYFFIFFIFLKKISILKNIFCHDLIDSIRFINPLTSPLILFLEYRHKIQHSNDR